MISIQAEIKELSIRRRDLELELKRIKNTIEEKKQILWDNCDHEWVRDWEYQDHKTQFCCKKCSYNK
jgi:hypothetical protein